MQTGKELDGNMANVDETLPRRIAEELTARCAGLYVDMDSYDHLAAKTVFLPPLFAESEILFTDNWFHENACSFGAPFTRSELEIALKASEDEDKKYTARCLIEKDLEFADCCEYLEDLILKRTYETSIVQAADYFKLPATVLKGLIVLSHMPIHAFPIGQFLSRSIQVNLMEAFLSDVNAPGTPDDNTNPIDDLPEGMRPYMSEEGVMVYPSAFKMMVLHKLLDEGVKVSELSKLYDLNTSLIGNWVRSYRNNRPMGTTKSQSGHCTKSIMQAYKQLVGGGDL